MSDHMQVTRDELIKAIRWRLGIPVDAEANRYAQICQRYFGPSHDQDQVTRLCRFFNDSLEQAIRFKLGLSGTSSPEETEFLESVWAMFRKWLHEDGQQSKRSMKVTRLIQDAIFPKPAAAAAPPATPRTAPAVPKPAVPPNPAPRPNPPAANRPSPPPAPPPPPPPPRAQAPAPVAAPAPPPAPVTAPAPSAPTVADPAATVATAPTHPPSPNGDAMTPPVPENNPSRPAGPLWRWNPVPREEDEPDVHEEHASSTILSPDFAPIIGARVRGKKHKHDGTNCDDWFTIGLGGHWTVIAVADGAGSRKFSRLGARASCEEAVKFLTARLERLPPFRPRATLEDGFDRRNDDGSFADTDLEYVQRALHDAMLAASGAVEQAFQARADKPVYEKLLGRKLDVNDLSATLLLAVHRMVKVKGADRSLVVSCQVGDGMIAALSPAGRIHLLAQPDSGEFSGETEFLTSRRKLEPDNLRKKTFVLLEPLRTLMVMTDGVADDYFPADPGMARLYADLVLNGILDPPRGLRGSAPTLGFDPADGRLDPEVETVTRDGPGRVKLRSAELYASSLGVPLEQLAAQGELLWAGTAGTPLGEIGSPDKRLQTWLDSYTVRGSFDDRTLVVLNRAEAS